MHILLTNEDKFPDPWKIRGFSMPIFLTNEDKFPDPWKMPYTFLNNPDTHTTMCTISVANACLQFLVNMRNSFDTSGQNYPAFACVTVLSLITLVGYTALNIAEAGIKSSAAVVLSVTLPFFIMTLGCDKDNLFKAIAQTGASFFFLSLFGFIQGTAQIAAGFFTAYKMVTHTGLLPNAEQLTDAASYGMGKEINSCLLEMIHSSRTF